MYDRYKDKKIDVVTAIEARGFIFGGALAQMLGVGFVPVRKAGKLPYKTYSEEYELEYATSTMEIHVDAIKKGQKVLVLDDLLATGGTLAATCKLVEKLGGEVVGMTGVPEVVLAREAGLCYASVGIATNYAAGLADEALSADEVYELMDEVRPSLFDLLREAVAKLNPDTICSCRQ